MNAAVRLGLVAALVVLFALAGAADDSRRRLGAGKHKKPKHHPKTTLAPALGTAAPGAPPTTSVGLGCPVLSQQELNTATGAFNKIKLNAQTCEVTALDFFGNTYYEYPNFTCGLAACVAHCYYDGECKYAVWSAKLQTCFKSVSIRVTDDPDTYLRYVDDDWVAMSRDYLDGGDSIVPYWSGECAYLLRGQCAATKYCGVNKGRKGENDLTMGGLAGFYCGRTKCTPTPL